MAPVGRFSFRVLLFVTRLTAEFVQSKFKRRAFALTLIAAALSLAASQVPNAAWGQTKSQPTSGAAKSPSGAALWSERALATYSFMQQHMWNPDIGNFARHTAAPVRAQKSDAWGITIVLDAYSYMISAGLMQPMPMKQYFESSTGLYERTNSGRGARIIARQGSQIYVGGDDDMQWIAALVHCYDVTQDAEYLEQAKSTFNALIGLGFWKKDSVPQGWAWNSSDQRPMGVSTAYGALAAARLYSATGQDVYKQWATVALNALKQPQTSFIPRDKMVAVQAYIELAEKDNNKQLLADAERLAANAVSENELVLKGKKSGERNPTDVAHLAEGLIKLAKATGKESYRTQAQRILEFFYTGRTIEDIKQQGFYSRYELSGKPDQTGAYLGVPNQARLLPEVAEMVKLAAMMARAQ